MADTKENGGPAFPGDEAHDVFNEDAGEYQTRWIWTGGMSLRDYFAAKAMQGMVGVGGSGAAGGLWLRDDDAPELARRSYVMADAMLKARG